MPTTHRWLLAAVVLGVVGFSACGDDASSLLAPPGQQATVAPPTSISGDPSTSGTLEVSSSSTTTTAAVTSSGDPPVSTEASAPAGVWDFDEALITEAIAEAEARPLEYGHLAGRDLAATALVNQEFASAGFDLSGLEMVVYPLGPSESFLLFLSDDETALLSVEGGFELFAGQLLSSPRVPEFGIERLVMQHRTSDDEGPLTVTFTVSIDDLREGYETGVDIWDRVAVQVERE